MSLQAAARVKSAAILELTDENRLLGTSAESLLDDERLTVSNTAAEMKLYAGS